jgi:hypothetical protein
VTVIFLIGVVIYYASVWGININLDDATSPEYVPMYKSTFCSLSGMLALGLFIHNAIITIVSNNRYPENNVSYSSNPSIQPKCVFKRTGLLEYNEANKGNYKNFHHNSVLKFVNVFFSVPRYLHRFRVGQWHLHVHRGPLLHHVPVAEILH